jgi:corrinoid protein of di/trimethylamine methyltransferase
MNNHLFEAMAQAVIAGEAEDARRLARQALAQDINPLDAINLGFVTGMTYVGEQFSCGEMFLPDMVLASEAMKAAIAELEPEMARLGAVRQVLGTIVIGTVEGDIHDIGKTLVATMLSASGFQVYDLGVNVAAPKLIARIRAVGANLVGLSTLLTTTMVNQRAFIQTLEAEGLRKQVKVLVGGAPVTRGWAEEIGADGYSEDAMGAVAVAKQLLGVE